MYFEWYASISILLLSSVRGFIIDGFRGVNICNGPRSYFGERYSDRVAWMRKNYPAGCTHVRHHLIITNLKENDDISFLEPIESVDGVLIIENNTKSLISLPNLKIVKGNGASNTIGKTIGVTIQNNRSPNGKEALVDLRSLRSVTHHDIVVQNNKNFCYLNSIDWNELIEDPKSYSTQAVTEPGCARRTNCAATCIKTNRCWGPGKDQCQKFSSCAESHTCFETRRCLDKNSCCSSVCAGGCTGKLRTDCITCRYFSNGTSCLRECPRQFITIQGQQVPNPKFLFDFGSFCVKKCPASFLEFGDSCVATCPGDHFIKDGKCSSCRLNFESEKDHGHQCKGHCHLSHIIENVLKKKPSIKNNPWLYKERMPIPFTWRSVLKELRNCTRLQAREGIMINDKATSQKAGDERVRRKDLENLKNLRDFHGSLYLNLTGFTGITSLNFLRNLQTLRGVGIFGVTGGQHLRYLGLKQLRELKMGTVEISKNPELCYMEHFTQRLPSTSKYIIEKNKELSKCQAGKDVCSVACAAKSGCWGPGREMCFTCKEVRAGLMCISKCSELPGFFTNTSNVKECARCHKQCINCNGPEANQCIGKCRNVEDNGVCRSQCKKKQYLEPITRRCHACNKSCVADSKGAFCSGPLSKPGPGGCNNCWMVEFVRNSKTEVQCRRRCPEKGFFQSPLRRTEKKMLGKYIGNSSMACRPCHPYCRECYGETEHQCFKCKKPYLKYLESKCVVKCPLDSFRRGHRCKPCHDQCYGCHGPTAFDCTECTHVRIYLNESIGIFKCNYTCPPSLPVNEYSKKYDDRVCFPAFDHKKRVVGAVVGSVVAFFLIVIIFVVVCVWINRRRAQLLKERELVHSKYTRRLEEERIPLSKTDQRPNYSQLRIISAKQLVKGNSVGTGQFGTVFRGKWRPEIEKDEVPIEIDVAIKELKSSDTATASKEFLSEAHVMASVNNPYCVHLLGVSLVSPMKLVSVFVPLGNLTRFMPRHRSEITSEIIMTWALQIAKGMAYLESKGIVHRDLAARNVLLQDIKLVRITDFGLAKLVDPGSTLTSDGGRLPVQWLALECLRDLQFSHKSDVWAYGVTLWEILTFATRKPYGSMKLKEIVNFLEGGERLEQPKNCSNEFFFLLLKCWLLEEDGRPTFDELVFELREMSNDPSRFISTEDTIFPFEPSVELKNILRRSNSPKRDDPDLSATEKPTYEAVLPEAQSDLNTAAPKTSVSSEEADVGGYLLPDRFGDFNDSSRPSSTHKDDIRFAPHHDGERSDGYIAVSTDV